MQGLKGLFDLCASNQIISINMVQIKQVWKNLDFKSTDLKFQLNSADVSIDIC